MSQVRFNTEYNNEPALVVAGWDRPLQYYHLTVFNNDENAEKECFYSDLDEPNPFSVKTIVPIQEKLKEMNIVPPDGFWDLVSKKEGNVFHTYVDSKWVRL